MAEGSKGRACGTCSLCCKLPYLPELNKPIDTWCRHCKPGKGCTIYADRPHNCRGFECGWLGGKDDNIGDEWFPARCKMILAPRVPGHTLAQQGVLVMVDPAYPNAWRKEPHYTQLLTWAQHIWVELRIGLRCISLEADGTEREVSRSQARIEGRAQRGEP